jgi:KaiC/GvpD/RAD55 family RecA-like ATPase
MERVKTGIIGFDELVEGGFPLGSAVLVSGAAGTGKSIFALQFLVEGAKAGEKGLYITFEQNDKELIEQAKQFGWDLNSFIKNGKLKIISITYPFKRKEVKDILQVGERAKMTIEKIEQELGGFKPARVVVDSLATITTALPPNMGTEQTREIIKALLSMLKEAGTTSILTSELSNDSKWFSRDEISEFLVDGIIVLNRLPAGVDFKRQLIIQKMRKTKFSEQISIFDIEPLKGIVIKPRGELYK